MSLDAHARDRRVPFLRTARSDEPSAAGAVTSDPACPYTAELLGITVLTICIMILTDVSALVRRDGPGDGHGMTPVTDDRSCALISACAAGGSMSSCVVHDVFSMSGVALSTASSTLASRLSYAVVLGICVCVCVGGLVKAAHTRSVRKANLALQLGLHMLPVTLCMLLCTLDASLVLRGRREHVVNLASQIAWSLSSYSIARLFNRMAFYAAGVEHANAVLDKVIACVALGRELLTVLARIVPGRVVNVACCVGVGLLILISIALKVHVMRPFFARAGRADPVDSSRATRCVTPRSPLDRNGVESDEASEISRMHTPACPWSLLNGNTTMTVTLTSVIVGMIAADATSLAYAMDLVSIATVDSILSFAIAARVLLLFACSVAVMLVEDEAQISEAMLRVVDLKIKAASDENKRRVYRTLFHELRVPLNSIALGLSLLHVDAAGTGQTSGGSGDSGLTAVASIAAAISLDSYGGASPMDVHYAGVLTSPIHDDRLQVIPASTLQSMLQDHAADERAALSQCTAAGSGKVAEMTTVAESQPQSLVTDPPPTHAQRISKGISIDADTVAFMRESASQMLALLSDMLDMEKMAARAFDVRYAPVNLNKLLHACVRAGMTLARAHGVCLTCEFDPRLPTIVHADALRLQQIMTNFASNAVKFTRPGVPAFVRLTASSIPLAQVADVTEPGQYQPAKDDMVVYGNGEVVGIRLACEDNGVGVDDAAIATLFTAFSQPNSHQEHEHHASVANSEATARGLRGTGLGLEICRQIADMHNGRVGCTSSRGQGSTFFADFRLRALRQLPVPGVVKQQLVPLRNALPVVHADVRSAAGNASSADTVHMDASELCDDSSSGAAFAAVQHAGAAASPLGALAAGAAGELIYELPARDAVLSASESSPIALVAPGLPRLRVLVVDDEASNRRLLARCIRLRMAPMATVSIEEAGDGMVALEQCRTHVYDAICMDSRMPRMGGEHAIRSMRTAGVLAHIIGVTGDADAEQEARFRAAGADDVMIKPVDVNALMRTLARVLERARQA